MMRRYPARRRHRSRNESALVFLTGAGLLAIVAMFKPPVPTWLPAPLAHAAAAVEGLTP